MSEYWLRRKGFNRRQVLRGAAAGSIGLAGLSIVGCGDDSSTSTPAAPTSPTAATTTAPTGTSTPASAANATAFETPSFTPAPNAGGTLVWGMESDIDPLDRIVWRLNYQIYESLVTRNLLTDELNPTIVPRLAKTWEQPDELTYIFRLQEGVKFHDGADFNAEAVKFNYLRGTDETHPNYFAAADTTGLRYIYQFTERVDTPDPLTVTYVNNRPFFDFLEIQSAFQFPGLISPKAIEEFGSEAIGKQHPIGTGPYRVKEQAAGERYVLEKNPDYWGMPGNLQEIMNRVLAAERLSEAQLVEARTQAEVQRINAQVEADARRQQAQLDAETQRTAAQAEAEALRIKTDSEVAALQAQAAGAAVYSAHPALLRLRELETLRELSRTATARLYIGFEKYARTPGDEDGQE